MTFGGRRHAAFVATHVISWMNTSLTTSSRLHLQTTFLKPSGSQDAQPPLPNFQLTKHYPSTVNSPLPPGLLSKLSSSSSSLVNSELSCEMSSAVEKETTLSPKIRLKTFSITARRYLSPCQRMTGFLLYDVTNQPAENASRQVTLVLSACVWTSSWTS